MAGKDFLGGAYRSSVKFAQGLDQYAGIARNVLGAVAPVVGSLSGPMGGAVGSAVGAGMKALGTYDTLKTQGRLRPMLLVAWGKHWRGFFNIFF